MFTSLRQRLLVTLGLIAIVPVVIISMYSYRYFNNVWVNMNTLNLAYLNSQTTNRLNDLFFKSIDQIFNWRERKEWADVVQHPALTSTYVQTVSYETPFIHPLFVLDKEGRILSTNARSKEGEPNKFQDVVGMIFPTHKELDHKDVAITKWQDLHLGSHKISTILLSFPIFDAHRDFIGMTVGLLNNSALHEVFLSEIGELKKRSFDSGIVAIVDRETRRVLASASATERMPLNTLEIQPDAESSSVIALNGEAWLALQTGTSFGENELLIVSLISQRNLLQTTQQLLTVSGLVYGLVFICIVIVVVLSTKALATPIRELATQAERFGTGDYTSVIRVQAKDEIGRLATLLNHARENIASHFEVTMAMSTELQLLPLLQRIMEATTTILRADRSTLFLADEKTDELWSQVAQGAGEREIRFPSHLGIAGTVFTTRETINIPDAYADSRFNQAMDQATGYHTRSILCMPLLNKAGQAIGAIEVLNKHNGPFTLADEKRLQAFAADASIALEKARLFEEVLNIKNYNESILHSLSNGVITLDAGNNIVTCNAAALEILHTTTQDIIGCAAATFFSGANAWILTKLQSVVDTGSPNITMDTEIVLSPGSNVAVNVTVVPLLNVKQELMGSMLVLENITMEKRIKTTMARYMTKEVVEKLLESGADTLGGQLQMASVLFSDIRNFTSLAERMGARETVLLLNEYFTRMVDSVFKYNGVLDKFIGDGLMAVFGAPFSSGEDADRAVKTGVDMMRVLVDYNQQRIRQAHSAIDIGIGISTDEVVSGNIGSLQRMDYTVIGDGVNLASRLEGANKLYKTNILISEFTFKQLKDNYISREIDVIRVKGKSKPVAVYEILDFHDDRSFPHLYEVLELYHAGLMAYRTRAWEESIRYFKEALHLNAFDIVSQLYLQRCEYYACTPPDEDWDGVWVMESK